MIKFENVQKFYKLKSGVRRTVLASCNVEFPRRIRMGVLGMNGAGKSTLLRLIAGSEQPNQGRIWRGGRVSFPVGFTGTFHPRHSARENLKFITQIYDMNYPEISRWVEDFSEIGKYFDMPISTYSSGMFARLAFATSFAFDFDVYLVDEAIEVGDASFRAKCAAVFEQRLKNSSLILVSQNISTIRQYCTSGAVLYDGQLTMFEDIAEALETYESLLRA